MSSCKKASKINKLVADGTRNYPSYLKLIYTGDSELSSEDETIPSRRNCHRSSGTSRLSTGSCRPNDTADSTHNKNVYHNDVINEIVDSNNDDKKNAFESQKFQDEEKGSKADITTHGDMDNLIAKNNNNDIKKTNTNIKTINKMKETIHTKKAISPSDPFPSGAYVINLHLCYIY